MNGLITDWRIALYQFIFERLSFIPKKAALLIRMPHFFSITLTYKLKRSFSTSTLIFYTPIL